MHTVASTDAGEGGVALLRGRLENLCNAVHGASLLGLRAGGGLADGPDLAPPPGPRCWVPGQRALQE